VPYYNKPTQEVSTGTSAPSRKRWTFRRSCTTFRPHRRGSRRRNHAATRADPNIIGIKDATASIERGSDCCGGRRRLRGLQRDDATCLALMLLAPRACFRHRQRRSAADARNVLGGARRDLKKARELNSSCSDFTPSSSSRRIRYGEMGLAQMGLIAWGRCRSRRSRSNSTNRQGGHAPSRRNPASGLRVVEGKAG